MKKIFLLGPDNISNEIKLLFPGDDCVSSPEDADVIFDSTNYPLEKKKENIRFIDENYPGNIPFITSSLCISVSEQASYSKFPNRLLGIGAYPSFSNSKIIEIAPSKVSDSSSVDLVKKIFSEIGMNCSIVPDLPGLVFPRIVSMIINEAVQVYTENIASKEDIDIAMKLGTNYPFGPLEWADKIGIELVYNILISLQNEFGEDRYRPHPALKEMVNLKRKFYE